MYLTISSNQSLTGPTDELHVVSIEPTSGGILWDYINSTISGGGLLRDVLIEKDYNGNLIIGFLKKLVSASTVQYVGLLKLDQNGNEYYAQGSTIPTPSQGSSFLSLHGIGHEHINENYILTGTFDHGTSSSSPDEAIFSMYFNEPSGQFLDFQEIIPQANTPNDRKPAILVKDDRSLIGFEIDNGQGILTVGCLELHNGFILKRVDYSIPSGKSRMYIVKMIKTDNEILALLALESNTSPVHFSYAIAKIDPNTLYMSGLTEIDYMPTINEEIPIDIIANGNEIYGISRFDVYNQNPTQSPYFKELKVTSLHQVLQGIACFPLIYHTTTNVQNPTTVPYNYPQTTFSYSGGVFTNDYFDLFPNLGYIKDCGGGIIQVYNKKESENTTTIPTNESNALTLINPVGEYLQIIGNESGILKQILIYDLKGALQLNVLETGNEKVDVRHLPTGIYMVKLMFIDGHAEHRKLVKN